MSQDHQPSYEDRRHELDTKMLKASGLASEQERRDFVTQAFTDIHKQYQDSQINLANYIKLIKRLAAFRQGEYNDYLDTLAGAALMGMLDLIVEQSKEVAEQSRQRSAIITVLTGIQPIQPDTE
jgi:hypothetical protein